MTAHCNGLSVFRLFRLASVLAAGTVGCGPGNDGPPRFDLSGSVTYDGKPVPMGYMTFAPDTSQSNSGPGGGAIIRNGRYRTEFGKGVVGGPHIVRIIGFDGVPTKVEGEEVTDGKPLFAPFEPTVDFPKKNGTHDFVVPKKSKE